MTEGLASETIVDGRYRVLSKLGSGGMADVYCAEDLQLGREVALKVLHSRFAADQEFVERFRREASSAAGLQHQHVVSVYDRGNWEGTYYIAMEYLRGRSLKQVIQQHAPLMPEDAIDLTIQVLRAARFAHRRGIIHRDLKPHNVIVDDEGRAKVTDFGIARAGASDMTQTGSIMGTAQYLSPEQAQGHHVDERSDLYSIGIILYELLTGRVPFEGESAVTIALKQVNEHPAPPSAFNAEVTPELEAVVMRAMEKDPARRYPDADAFIAALENVRAMLQGAPASVVHAAPVVVEDEEPRRWWIWTLAVLAVVGAIVAGVLLLGGSDTKTVPDVVGADVASAETRLREDGFSTDTEQRNSEQPEGEVLSTDPEAGEEADEGSTVVLTVSAGPGTAPVPDVEGVSRQTARERLRDAGFDITEREESSADVPEGRAIRTSPPAGTEQEKGATVTLLLSTGPEQVSVPDVVGDPFDEARADLERAGFVVSRRDQVTDDEEPGTVLKQTPGAGQEVDKGATVTVSVAKEPRTVEVPDVTGETQSDAVTRLSQDGFEIATQDREVDSPEGDGVVVEQSPASGRADRGSTVTIIIGRFNPALNPEGQTTTTAPATPTTPTTP